METPDSALPPQLEAVVRRTRPRPATSDSGPQAVKERALAAARAAAAMKAEDVRVLDMREVVSYTDFLVICTGRNVRLTKRIAEEVGRRLKLDYGVLPAGTEGETAGEWILLDYLDFIVHVFTPESREFYRLDVLWKQAPVESVE